MKLRPWILSGLFTLTMIGLVAANEYYTHGSFPTTGSAATSAGMRAEFDLVTAGFNNLPALAGRGGTAIVVNGGGTALTNTIGQLALSANFTLAGGNATTLTTTGVSNLTLPALTDTLLSRTSTDTLTNKTLTSPTINSPTFGGTASGSLTNLSLTTPTLASPTFSGTASGSLTNLSLTTPTLGSPVLNGTVSGSAVIGYANGGTGLSAAPTNGQLAIGNGAGYTLAAPTGSGTGTSITTGAGSLTVVAEGFSTGDVKLTFKNAADTGWVMMNDGTIGSATSGATTRANADTQTLYTLFWNNCTNQWCAVTGGRGANAAADFSANKPLQLPRAVGRALAGLGSATTTESIVSQTASGNAVPVQSNTATWITGMQVTVSGASGFTGLTNGTWYIVRASSTTVQFATSLANSQNGTVATVTGTGSAVLTWTGASRALGEALGEEAHAQNNTELLSHTHTGSNGNFLQAYGAANISGGGFASSNVGSINSTGGNTAANLMQPTLFMSVMVKL